MTTGRINQITRETFKNFQTVFRPAKDQSTRPRHQKIRAVFEKERAPTPDALVSTGAMASKQPTTFPLR